MKNIDFFRVFPTKSNIDAADARFPKVFTNFARCFLFLPIHWVLGMVSVVPGMVLEQVEAKDKQRNEGPHEQVTKIQQAKYKQHNPKQFSVFLFGLFFDGFSVLVEGFCDFGGRNRNLREKSSI